MTFLFLFSLEQEAALEDSVALAKKLEEEEEKQASQAHDEALKQIEDEDKAGTTEKEEPKGKPVTSYVKQDIV